MKTLLAKIFTIVFVTLFYLASQQSFAARDVTAKEQLTASNSAISPSGSARVAGDIKVDFENTKTTASMEGNFFTDNWGVLALSLLAFAETVVRLTPSQKDNSILRIISTILNSLIPNYKKGGGVF